MKSNEFRKPAKDGVELYYQEWRPEGEVEGVIALVHGMGEHIWRYAHVAAYFVEKGWAVLGFDHRGHGKSGGPRGHTPSYDCLLDDVKQLLEIIAGKFPGAPVILYGHSMGGNVVTNFILHRNPDLAGAIISAPWLRLAFEPPKFKVFLGRLMNGIFPGLTQSSELDTSALSRDKKVVEAYIKDPLVHDKISARMFVSCYEAGLNALEKAHEPAFPILLIHGTQDKLTHPDGTVEFAKKVGPKATLKLWDGFFHELHNEPEQKEVLDFEWNWIVNRNKNG
ncbi:MAG: lysophospholipase [Bacteroidia bacterium]|nr:lysophospholipase [Bacteroidia bacterium]